MTVFLLGARLPRGRGLRPLMAGAVLNRSSQTKENLLLSVYTGISVERFSLMDCHLRSRLGLN